MKNKLSPLVLLGLLFFAVLPLVAKADPTDVRPPTVPNHESVAAVMQLTNDVEIVFLEDVEDVEITVVAEDGTTVYHERGSACAYNRVAIDASRWKGKYHVKLSCKSKQQLQAIEYR